MFYRENARRYIYRNYLALIGLASLYLVFGGLIAVRVYYFGNH